MAHTIFNRIDRENILWINYLDYAGELLSSGKVQWTNVAECIAWYRKAQSLLKSHVLHVDLGLICDEYIKSDIALTALMGEKNKPIAPLKELLAYAPLRSYLSELVTALRVTFPNLILALVCPSPGRWVGDAYSQIFPDAAKPSIGEDEVDYGCLYMADFLRVFAEANVDALLLDDDELTEEFADVYMPCYQTIVNLAGQYRWKFGLKFSNVEDQKLLPDVDFILSTQVMNEANVGLEVNQLFWLNEDASTLYRNHLLYCQIPITAKPERVLDGVGKLSSGS